jgi:galactose mutarotase-like enzyme
MTGEVVLESADLRAVVTPALGGTVTRLRALGPGADLLAIAPWAAKATALPRGAADEADWLRRFCGGWPVMFPNAGDACSDGDVWHGFHGEGSVTPWEAAQDGATVTLRRHFATVPVTMTRRLAVDGPRLTLDETVVAAGDCTVVWGQHVTFGADLLAGPVTLTTGAAGLAACASYDPPANPLRPGATGRWPVLPGKSGPVDLSRPPEGAALLACLTDPGPTPWVQILREDGLGLKLEWTADPWPLAWLWVETGGTRAAPWNGAARMIAVEPCSTWPATGLVAARAAGGPVIRLAAGDTRRARLSLTLISQDSKD